MEQLVKITEVEGQKAVSAFDLFNALGYESKNFYRWKKQNTVNNEFSIKGIDWDELHINEENKTNKANDCVFSVDFAKRVCMLARTETGEKIRRYFIDVEKNSQNNFALQLLKQHFEIKKRLEANKEARKAANRLVYRDSVELQENENKMLHLLSADDSMHFATLQTPAQKTLFD